MIFDFGERRLFRGAFGTIVVFLSTMSAPCRAQDDLQDVFPAPVSQLEAVDTPNDHGKSVDLSWTISPDDGAGRNTVIGYEIWRSKEPEGEFELVGKVLVGSEAFVDGDTSLVNGRDYYYKVRTLADVGASDSEVMGPVQPSGQWFHSGKKSVLAFSIVFSIIIVAFIIWAQRGKKLYVRPIAGIKAVDEAIGRATEMGKPILFVLGLGEASEVATIAGFTVLARVAKRTAEYQTRIIVPNAYATVMIVAQEVVKAAYMDAGRPERYDERDIFYLTSEQFPYAAAVNGIMLRQRPAANFYLGKFYAESLVLAETGFQAGSIQIAGTDEVIQIPFFVAACDYTLIGEELYAASAYLSQDPRQLGTLKGQDWSKVILIAIILLGIVFATIGFEGFLHLFDVNL